MGVPRGHRPIRFQEQPLSSPSASEHPRLLHPDKPVVRHSCKPPSCRHSRQQRRTPSIRHHIFWTAKPARDPVQATPSEARFPSKHPCDRPLAKQANSQPVHKCGQHKKRTDTAIGFSGTCQPFKYWNVEKLIDSIATGASYISCQFEVPAAMNSRRQNWLLSTTHSDTKNRGTHGGHTAEGHSGGIQGRDTGEEYTASYCIPSTIPSPIIGGDGLPEVDASSPARYHANSVR